MTRPASSPGTTTRRSRLGLCLKDLGLLAELEEAVGADLPMTAAARAAFARAAERYGERCAGAQRGPPHRRRRRTCRCGSTATGSRTGRHEVLTPAAPLTTRSARTRSRT